MRVLHVMADGTRGGGADHLLGLLPALTARGIQCVAAVGREGPTGQRLRELGCDVWPLQLMSSRTAANGVRSLGQVISEAAPAVVHCHGTRGAFYATLARASALARASVLARASDRRPLPPIVYTAHGLSYRKQLPQHRRLVFLGAEGLICRMSAQVISVSCADLLDLRRKHLLAQEKGVHIPNALDAQRFRPPSVETRESSRQALGISSDAFVIGTVSRLVPQKSVADLVGAFRLIASSVPEARLVIVGDGPQREMLSNLCAGLGGRVQWLGARDDVPSLLAVFDLFALSSRWEGEPIALIEAMAAGKACVATATEGAQELLQHDKTGMLVPVGDTAALAAAFEGMARAPERRVALGRAAHQAMAGRSYEAQAAQVEAVYRDVAVVVPS